jgi:diguanylate cyclase (GGDEF)-like protein/PAS domain S-box-containing protein
MGTSVDPAVLDLLPDPALVVADGLVVQASTRAEALFRRPLPAGTELAGLLPGAPQDPQDGPATGLRADGTPFPVEASTGAVPGGTLVPLRELAFDRVLGESQRFFDVAFDHAPIGMALYTPDGEFARVNDAMCRLLGRPRQALLGSRDMELTHPDDRAADLDGAWQVLRGERSDWMCEKRFVRPDGDVVWCLAHLVFLRDELGRPLSWVGQFVDVTARHVAEGTLRRLAERDPLTDVLNRRAFDAALATCDDAALVLLDLDHFKAVNDRFGHAAGDEVLRAVAGVLHRRLRAADVVARLGGDEFAVLLPGVDAASAEAVAADVLRMIRGLVLASGRVSASVGVATGTSGAALLQRADRALYAAKAAGRGRAQLAA